MWRRKLQLQVNRLFDIIATQRFQLDTGYEAPNRRKVDAILDNGDASCIVVLDLDRETLGLLHKIWVLYLSNFKLCFRVSSRIKSTLIDNFDDTSRLIDAEIQIDWVAKNARTFDTLHLTCNQIKVLWEFNRYNAALLYGNRHLE